MIGNGFDIEHKLPTQYKDFLQFTKEFLKIYASGKRNEEIEKIGDEDRKRFFENIFFDCDGILCENLNKNLKQNIWIDYFNRNLKHMKRNWIDFESEISRIIILLEKAKLEYEKKALIITQEIPPSDAYNMMRNELYLEEKRNIVSLSGEAFTYQKKTLLNDLNRLINALEIYLAEYVSELNIPLYNGSIEKLNPTHILSFNYTNTYEKIYNIGCRRIEYDFIHGMACKRNADFCNMVLGIDEYLTEDERQENIEFIEFQKYYQRMQKRTECNYKKWKEQIAAARKNNNDSRIELFIFGHSLDSTDKDVLREFLLNDDIVATIFYYNQEAYERELANLVKVLGADELLFRMYGKNPRIRFEQQQPSYRICNSEFDIKKDIQKLYVLQKYDNEEINDLLTKIDYKIQTKDTKYFCSQQNIISLYDALIRWDICSKEQKENLLQIAKEMASTERYIFHNSEQWNDYDYRGDHGCPIKTMKFINAINTHNENVFHCVEDNIDNLSELEIVNKYQRQSNISEEKFEKILDKLIPKSESEYIWKGICQIANNNLGVAQSIIKKMMAKQISSIYKIRLTYLCEFCEETEYYQEQERSYLENQDYQ